MNQWDTWHPIGIGCSESTRPIPPLEMAVTLHNPLKPRMWTRHSMWDGAAGHGVAGHGAAGHGVVLRGSVVGRQLPMICDA